MKFYKNSVYIISNDGKVLNTKTGNILKNRIQNGYCRVVLYINGKKRDYMVHRLVAELYINNPNNLPVVNHINNNRSDNRVENLEWCTQKENVHHAKKQGRHIRGERAFTSKLKETDIKPILELIKSGMVLTKIAEIYNVRYQSISAIKRGINWKYITNNEDVVV